jgi:glutamate racemase
MRRAIARRLLARQNREPRLAQAPRPSATDSRAIGIFDSGLGGLTVARAVRRSFPNERICYLGDTARVPYGTKSPETVQLYARQNIAFLLAQGVKLIVAACNTVSAAALPFLNETYEAPILGVVEMGVEAALRDRPRRIGVIGTETTVASGAYARAIARRAPEVEVAQKACPFFVPLIEELWLDHPVTRLVIQEYLSPMREAGIDTLILGCTHYPLIRPALADFFGPTVRLVDSAEAMALAVRRAFETGAALPAARKPAGPSRYYVTDRCNRFQTLVGAFMGETDIAVEQISSDALGEALANSR